MADIDSQEQLQIFNNEINIIALCSECNNVTQFLSAYYFGEKLWIVIELCKGGSISDLMDKRKRGMTEPEVRVVARVLGCLAAWNGAAARTPVACGAQLPVFRTRSASLPPLLLGCHWFHAGVACPRLISRLSSCCGAHAQPRGSSSSSLRSLCLLCSRLFAGFVVWGAIPRLQLQAAAYQMLDSLTFLHSKNVIHRDINSANTMVTENGVIKLGDFGVSCISGKSKKRNTFIGTPLYMAPEVINCDPAREEKKCWYQQECDVWSLGITFIEFAGEPCRFAARASSSAAAWSAPALPRPHVQCIDSARANARRIP